MSKRLSYKHPIQQHIIGVLKTQKNVRFRQLRPARVDSNLFTYHLHRLVSAGIINKSANGYSLSDSGLQYVARYSEEKDFSISFQPDIQLMFVIQNSDGDILLSKRQRQPYIDTWGLLVGVLQESDVSLLQAAQRIIFDQLAVRNVNLEHAGDCYVRVLSGDVTITHTLVHVFRLYIDKTVNNSHLLWARPHKLAAIQLSPATEHIMTRTFFKDPFYFEEYNVNWYTV